MQSKVQPLLRNFYVGNIRGLYSLNNQCKVPMLEETLQEKSLIFLILAETHLNKDIVDAEINIKNFTLFRADRTGRSHGGVTVYLREYMAGNVEILLSFSNGTTEVLAVNLKKAKIILVILSRLPNAAEEKWFWRS